MRVLLTTRGSSGHLIPLAPIARACREAGHEVLVSTQAQHRANVEREGLPFAELADPPAEEWMPMLAEFGRLGIDAADKRMIGEFFAGVDTRAALPGLLAIIDDWKPDLIVRESWEFASTIAGELRGIPLARVALGLASVEERTLEYAAAELDAVRVAHGLAPDPEGERLRGVPYLTMTPEPLDAGSEAVAPEVHRFRPPREAAKEELGDWWPGNDDPLLYLTFGSVTAGAHLGFFPALYVAVLDALGSLPVRVLLTIGEPRDPGELGPLPPNVHVETWFPQQSILREASAVVCHGGYGTTLGALAAGVPLIVLPLFSSDQWDNAAAVARSGAGIALDRERATQPVLALPGDGALQELAPAALRVLEEPGFRAATEAVARAVDSTPPVADLVDVLYDLANPT